MIAVVTANFGGFDIQHEIPPQDIQFDRFYFTEKNSPLPLSGLSNRLKAKYFKILTHRILSNYDVFVWMDANIQVKSSDFVRTVAGSINEVAISRHPFRDTTEQEFNFIRDQIKSGSKYLSERYKIDALQAELLAIDYPKDLYWCGLFARLNTSKVNAEFEKWWNWCIEYTDFDQNTFSEVARHLRVNTFELGNFYDNPYYRLSKHLK